MSGSHPEFVPPDGGYGWVVIGATTVMNVCLLPLIQCFGIIYQHDFKEMGITGAEKSFLLHLNNAIFCILGLLSSPLLRKYNYRQVALFGTSLMIVGILLSSFAKSYIHLIFSVSILMGIGQGILLPATYVATNSYFKKRLTLAMCLSITGAGLSPIFMPQVCRLLLIEFGTRDTVLILFAVSIVAIFACLLLKPVEARKKRQIGADICETPDNLDEIMIKQNSEKEPSKDESNNKLLPPQNGTVYQDTTTSLPKDSFIIRVIHFFNLELLKDRKFIVILIGMTISYASELNIILMIQFILPELAGFGPDDVSLSQTVLSIADLIGRLGIPIVAHSVSVPAELMYVASLMICTFARTFLAILHSTRFAVLCCCALVGLGKGTKAVYQSVIIPKYVTLEMLPPATGLSMLFNGFLSLIIGPFLGLIHDMSHSYIYALHAASILSTMCVMLWGFEYLSNRRRTIKSSRH